MSGRVVHFEVPFDDAERALGFYRDLFGWEIQSMPEMNYNIASTGPTGDQGPTEPGYIGGGLFQRQAPIDRPVLVIDVDDIDAKLTEIEAHGGSTALAKMPVGDMGWAAYFTDTEGNILGLWQTNTG